MDIRHVHEFAATTAEVAAMLADPDFARERGGASGAEAPQVGLDGDPDRGFTVVIRQSVPSTSIPSEFRSFVGSDLTVRYTEVWEPATGAERRGTFAMEIVGAPGHAAGELGLAPTDAGSIFIAEGAVSVRVPMFGPMIERAVSEAVLKGLRAELDAADAWLARQA